MFDAAARRALDRPLARIAGSLDRVAWVTPNRITLLGLALGVGSAAASAARWWPAALVLWLVSRIADGLDGPLARHRRTPARQTAQPTAQQVTRSSPELPSQAGGFLDISADFVVYGATVVGVAVGVGGSPWPFMAVLLAYYINGSVFLAFSSIAERTGRTIQDGRSLSFLGGLAEGTETIVVHSLWCLFPSAAAQIASVWAVVVGVSAAHRIWAGYRDLR